MTQPTDNAWLDEIITIGAIELKEYELTEALRKQGVTPALYPTLTPEATQAILTHIDTVCREAEIRGVKKLVDEMMNDKRPTVDWHREPFECVHDLADKLTNQLNPNKDTEK